MRIFCTSTKYDVIEDRPIMSQVEMVKITKFNIPNTIALHLETQQGFDPITMIPTAEETKFWNIFLKEVTLTFDDYNMAKAYFYMLLEDELNVDVRDRHPEFFV